MRPLVSLLTLLAAVTAIGCSPCAQRCSAEAAVFERCLGQWDLEWADVGAVDETDFADQCTTEVQVYVNSLGEEQAQAERQQCSELDSNLRGETDCDAAWESLVNYGVEP